MSSDGPVVVVAGGSPLVRSALRESLGRTLGGRQIDAADADDVRALVTKTRVDVVVSATTLGQTPVVEVLPEILASGTVVLLVCARDSMGQVPDLLLAGAAGYLVLEDCTAADLAAGVRSAVAGGVTLHPEVARLVLEQWRAGRQAQRPVLSGQEQVVLRGIAGGLTVRESARDLGISTKTVESHRARLYAKLGVNSQAAAVARATEWHLLEDPEPTNDTRGVLRAAVHPPT